MFKYARYIRVVDEFTTHEFTELNEKCKVNKFDVPYVSVECANESDFLELLENQNPIIAAVEILKEEFAVGVENSAQVKRIYDRANEHFAMDMHSISAKYTKEECDSWAAQVSEAEAYLAGTQINTPFLDALCLEDSIAPQEAAQKILEKKNTYAITTADALKRKWSTITSLKSEIGL